MAKKYENEVIVTWQEYDKAISAILGDKDPENCTSVVEVYAMFDKIAKCITESNYYNEMSVVDSTRLDDSIASISNVLKGMIGDETLNHAIVSHLGKLDDDTTSGADAESEDGSDENSDDAIAEYDDCESESQFSDYYVDADGESKSDDTSNEDAAEKDNDLIDVKRIDMFKVWHAYHTIDFNDFDGYVLLAIIGRRHGFDSGYVAEQLLYIMHNYSIGCNIIHYIGAAITTNSVQEAFKKDPKAGDLVYFAYCEKPTFVMYSNMSGNNWRYIIYQFDKETSAVIEIYDKPDLKSVCDFLNKVDVDKTAFSTGFDELKNLCQERDINFNMLYRKVVECYICHTQGTHLSINHVSNIKFYITRKFDTRDEYIRYAVNYGFDGDLFLIDNRPTREYSNRNNGWVMIFGLIAGCYADKTKKLLQVNAVKIADCDETVVSSKPTLESDDESDTNAAADADDGDDIDVSSMKYMTNEDISKNIKNGYDEMMRHMNDNQ